MEKLGAEQERRDYVSDTHKKDATPTFSHEFYQSHVVPGDPEHFAGSLRMTIAERPFTISREKSRNGWISHYATRATGRQQTCPGIVRDAAALRHRNVMNEQHRGPIQTDGDTPA